MINAIKEAIKFLDDPCFNSLNISYIQSKDENVLNVSKEGNDVAITYGQLSSLFRGLTLVKEHKDEIGMPFEDLIVSTAEKSPLRDKWQKRMEIDCRQKWKEIIEEMRYYFLESNEDTCTKYPYSDMSHDDYFKKHDEIYNYQIECRKKAFDLLCKWGDWLWE